MSAAILVQQVKGLYAGKHALFCMSTVDLDQAAQLSCLTMALLRATKEKKDLMSDL